ncbi:unnamed protein product [Natator depressus]
MSGHFCINFRTLNDDNMQSVDSWFDLKASLENVPPAENVATVLQHKPAFSKANLPQAIVSPMVKSSNTISWATSRRSTMSRCLHGMEPAEWGMVGNEGEVHGQKIITEVLRTPGDTSPDATTAMATTSSGLGGTPLAAYAQMATAPPHATIASSPTAASSSIPGGQGPSPPRKHGVCCLLVPTSPHVETYMRALAWVVGPTVLVAASKMYRKVQMQQPPATHETEAVVASFLVPQQGVHYRVHYSLGDARCYLCRVTGHVRRDWPLAQHGGVPGTPESQEGTGPAIAGDPGCPAPIVTLPPSAIAPAQAPRVAPPPLAPRRAGGPRLCRMQSSGARGGEGSRAVPGQGQSRIVAGANTGRQHSCPQGSAPALTMKSRAIGWASAGARCSPAFGSGVGGYSVIFLQETYMDPTAAVSLRGGVDVDSGVCHPCECLGLGGDFNTTLEERDRSGTESSQATMGVLPEIVHRHSLVDIWLGHHQDDNSTFTYVQMEVNRLRHSWLDCIYLSRSHLAWVHSSSMQPAPFSDHHLVAVTAFLTSESPGPACWHFTKSLLEDVAL